MKKIIVAVAAFCLLSVVSYANGGKNKGNKHAVKKEQKASKKVNCPATCPATCPHVGCNQS